MRVLLNTYPVAFDCPGGGEAQLQRYAEQARRRGVDVRLHDIWNPCLSTVDLVHYFSLMGGSMNFCGYVKQQRKLPLIISTSLWLTDALRPLIPMREIHSLLHLADFAMPNSLAEREQLSEAFDLSPDRFRVIYNGVDPTFGECVAPEIFREKYDLSEPFLLNIANIESRKNQLRLARAAKQLDIPLVLCGHVRDEQYLAACKTAGGSSFRYAGPIEHASELHRSALAACAGFVLPSLLETPGLAALEAAAAGSKLLITQEGSTSEYFGELAHYADPLEQDSITSGIETMLGEDVSRDLAPHILDRFCWSNIGQQLVATYGELLAIQKVSRCCAG